MAKLSVIEARKAVAMEDTATRLARTEAMVEAIYLKTFGKPFEDAPEATPAEAAPAPTPTDEPEEAAPAAEEPSAKKKGK